MHLQVEGGSQVARLVGASPLAGDATWPAAGGCIPAWGIAEVAVTASGSGSYLTLSLTCTQVALLSLLTHYSLTTSQSLVTVAVTFKL